MAIERIAPDQPMEQVLTEEHRTLATELRKRAAEIPGVRLFFQSYPGSLAVCVLVDSDDEEVWDKVSDLEYEASKDNEESVLVFRECNIRTQDFEAFRRGLPRELAKQLPSEASAR